jgi:hypothetical protein
MGDAGLLNVPDERGVPFSMPPAPVPLAPCVECDALLHTTSAFASTLLGGPKREHRECIAAIHS